MTDITQEQFVNRWRHEIGGMILDGAVAHRSGAELSVFLRMILGKLDRHLIAMYADLTREGTSDKPVTNGSRHGPGHSPAQIVKEKA